MAHGTTTAHHTYIAVRRPLSSRMRGEVGTPDHALGCRLACSKFCLLFLFLVSQYALYDVKYKHGWMGFISHGTGVLDRFYVWADGERMSRSVSYVRFLFSLPSSSSSLQPHSYVSRLSHVQV